MAMVRNDPHKEHPIPDFNRRVAVVYGTLIEVVSTGEYYIRYGWVPVDGVHYEQVIEQWVWTLWRPPEEM